jgi:hypothetical protein
MPLGIAGQELHKVDTAGTVLGHSIIDSVASSEFAVDYQAEVLKLHIAKSGEGLGVRPKQT